MSEEKSQLLFSGFEKVTDDQWLEKIKQDLKGKSVDEISKEKIFEDISLKPYYSNSDRGQQFSIPGNTAWKIRLHISDLKSVQSFIQNESGVDEFVMDVTHDLDLSALAKTEIDLNLNLHSIENRWDLNENRLKRNLKILENCLNIVKN